MSTILTRIGGDNSDLRSTLIDSEKQVERSFKRLAKVGVGLGGFALIANSFRSIVDYARNLEDPMDANLQRAQQFAQGLDSAKVGMLEIGAKALGVVNSLGEWWGRQIAIIQNGREQVELGERIEAQTKETLAALEAQRVKTLEINDAKKGLLSANQAYAESEAKAAGSAAVLALRRKEWSDAVIAAVNAQAGSAESIRLEAEAVKALIKLKEAERDVVKDTAKETPPVVKKEAERVPIQKAVTAEMLKQQAALEAMNEAQGKMNLLLTDTLIINGKLYGASRDQKALQDASSDELKEVIRQARAEIAAIEGTKGRGDTALAEAATGFLVRGAVQDRLRTDISRAQFQLNLRSGVERDIARGGVDAARRNFAGDPLEFDSFVSRFVNSKPFNEQTDLLRKLVNRFEQPLRVIDSSNPSPFPRN